MRTARTGKEGSDAAPAAAAAAPIAPATRERRLAAAVKRSQWIRCQLTGRFFGLAMGRRVLSVLLVPVIAAFCWGHANRAALLLWLFSAVAIGAARLWVVRQHARRYAKRHAEIQWAFAQRLWPIAVLEGAFWGASVWLFFLRIPAIEQFGCWAVLAIQSSGPLTRLGFIPRLMKAYTNAIFLVALAGVGWAMASSPEALRFSPWFAALVVFQWFNVHYQARAFFRNQSEHFGLQYDLARKERQALEAVRTRNRFLAVATHDLRQPVAALRLYVDFLNEEPEASAELAPKIARATAAVSHLFDSLFDLSSLDSGQVRPSVQPVQIAEVIRDLQLQHEPVAAARHIRLRIRTGEALIHTDRVRLQRMVGNVLSNAIKYSHPGKEVLLAVRGRRTGVRIEVWDQGIGIPADQIDRVFDEFYKVPEGAALSNDGVGLGLSLVARLAKTLESDVCLRSTVGKGTRCSFRLGTLAPAAANEGPEETVSRGAAIEQPGSRR